MDIEVGRAIGRIEGRVDGLESRLSTMEAKIYDQLAELNTKVQTLIESRSELKGGWKAIAILAGVVCTLATAGAWLIDKFPIVMSRGG